MDTTEAVGSGTAVISMNEACPITEKKGRPEPPLYLPLKMALFSKPFLEFLNQNGNDLE